MERISLYSSKVRPLKLVSRGRGYWSQAGGERREGGLVPQQHHLGPAILEKPGSDRTHWAAGVTRDQRPGRQKSSATWSPRCGLASTGIIWQAGGWRLPAGNALGQCRLSPSWLALVAPF